MFRKQRFYFFQVDFGSASVRRTFLGRFERSSSPGGSFTSGAPPPGKRNWTFWPKGFNSLTRMWVVLFVFVVVDVVVVVCCCFCCVVVGVMVELVLEGALQSRKEKLDFLAERVKQSYKNVSLFKCCCCFCCCCWCYCSISPEGSSTRGAPPPGKRNWTFWLRGYSSPTRMWVVFFVFVLFLLCLLLWLLS